MDDWNKPLTDEEMKGIDAAFEAAAASFTTSSSSSFQFEPPRVSSSDCSRFSCFTCSSKLNLAPHRSLAKPTCKSLGYHPRRKTFYSQRFLDPDDISNWPFYGELKMAKDGRAFMRVLEKYVDPSMINLLVFKSIRPRFLPMAVEEASMGRKWDEMDHDILVTIMKSLVQGSYSVQGFTLLSPFVVCKSWMSAVLDTLFPPGNVLDLRVLEAVSMDERCYYQFYLKFLLQRPHQFTKLFYPTVELKDGAGTYIAQRLSTLKCVVHLDHGLPCLILHRSVPYWPELTEAHCDVVLTGSLSIHCKYIRKLDLYGRIGNDRACTIAYHFPHLIHLSIPSCILSTDALNIILQGQRDLSYLDTRHAICIKPHTDPLCHKDGLCGSVKGRVIEWDEEAILQKAVGIKTYLHCARKSCSYCGPLYSPDISHKDMCRLTRFSWIREAELIKL